jgi:flagellar basal-body rod protein FlgG
MLQGIYLASQSMSTLMDKQDLIANNLANINTTGYKESNLFAKTFQKALENDQRQPFVNQEIHPDQVYTDYTEGAMRATGSSFDAMIKGSGFFTIMTPDGIRYSRNGNFSLDAEGYLVTNQGGKVMSTNGYIRIEKDKNPTLVINERGEVTQDEQPLGQLRIADFQKPYKMVRDGDSMFRPLLPDNPEIPSAGCAIKQGYLEGSNVNIIRNMVQMIGAYRNFEADQRAMLAQDQTLDKAVNQVGRVG